MIPSAEKLGLFLPEGLHQDMLDTAERLNTRKNPRGCVRLIYERAFRELVEALDRGETVTFPAVRGAKDRVSVRLSKPLSREQGGLAALLLQQVLEGENGLPHIMLDRPRRFGRRDQDQAPEGGQGKFVFSPRLGVGDHRPELGGILALGDEACELLMGGHL